MPTPHKGESKRDYIKRCIPYVIKEEGKTVEQAAGKCYGMYKQWLKKKDKT